MGLREAVDLAREHPLGTAALLVAAYIGGRLAHDAYTRGPRDAALAAASGEGFRVSAFLDQNLPESRPFRDVPVVHARPTPELQAPDPYIVALLNGHE